MAEIKNLQRLYRKLEKLERDSRRKNNGNVVVGYSASYALYVHENKEAKHNAGQQAKFLEEPARTKQREIMDVVKTELERGVGLIKALIEGGLRLQRESQELVPVDIGNLKASAFTEKE